MKKYITVISSLSALVLSIIALCFAAYRTPNLSFDYMGVIVGVLALLITALIGYNIYSLIDLRRIQEQYEKVITEVTNLKNDVVTKAESLIDMSINNMASHSAFALIFQYLMREEEDFVVSYLISQLSVAYLSTHNNDFHTCIKTIDLIMGDVNPEALIIDEKIKKMMFKLADQIMYKDKITNYADLLCFIAKINTKKNS